MSAPAKEVVFVDDARGLSAAIDMLAGQPRLALDTEFHREKTYRPHLALLQLATLDMVVIVDPLGVDVAPLAEALAGVPEFVMHAASQDIEVLESAMGFVPARVLDTQLAAGFVGLSSPSLSVLHSRILGTSIPKGDRLTDWLRRPLRPSQLDYAAADVARLLELWDLMLADVTQRGRRTWVEAEHEGFVERMRNPRDPDDAWLKVRELRNLRGAALAVGQAVAAWRERRASDLDIPCRHVLSDISLASIAQARPADDGALDRIRGLDSRSLKPGPRAELMAVIARASSSKPRVDPNGEQSDRSARLRPAVTLLSAWLNDRARALDLDPALLATRDDIEASVAGDPASRLSVGWRGEVVGGVIQRLLDGEAALAFDPDGGLLLEARSHEPL